MNDRLSTLLLLTTDRLRLRAHESSDAGWLQSIYSQPEVAQYLLDEPWTLDVVGHEVLGAGASMR